MARWATLAAALAVFPWVPGVGLSTIGTANLAASYALVGISLVVLTGWVGQISLGHAAFVGIGSYATGWAAGALHIPFPVSIVFAMAFGAAAAAGLGIVALRVRGLFLAVATLIFSWMASEFLFHQKWIVSHDDIPARPIGGSETLPMFDFTNRRTFFYVAWALVGCTVFIAVNVRDSKTGRAFFAIRGSEMATASLGIDVTRYKLLAFAVSGALAGAAGNLLMSDARAVVSDQFTFTRSLFFLSIAVVGGLRSLGGAVSSAVFFAGLYELFFRFPTLGGYLELVSALLLAATLIVYPGGMAGLGQAAARGFARLHLPALPRLPSLPTMELGERFKRLRLAVPGPAVRLVSGAGQLRLALLRQRGAAEPLLEWSEPPAAAVPAGGSAGAESPAAPISVGLTLQSGGLVDADTPRHERRILLEADGVTVKFGGLTAVDAASLQVREGEIVGLIGPNGAGKTTLFNTIAGFVRPTSGAVRLFGQDATAMPVHTRAAMGVARTFQAIQLFPQLTVFENLLVATHLQNSTGFPSHVVVSAAALDQERRARQRVRKCLDLLDLGHVADSRVADLPFGVLRMVEVARAMVTGFRLMMLDEPASGLDDIETERLADVVRFLKSLGVSVLLIEHDVAMVTGVSDQMYVLEQGRIIAEGTPGAIQDDPAVIAAYLGEAEASEVA